MAFTNSRPSVSTVVLFLRVVLKPPFLEELFPSPLIKSMLHLASNIHPVQLFPPQIYLMRWRGSGVVGPPSLFSERGMSLLSPRTQFPLSRGLVLRNAALSFSVPLPFTLSLPGTLPIDVSSSHHFAESFTFQYLSDLVGFRGDGSLRSSQHTPLFCKVIARGETWLAPLKTLKAKDALSAARILH